MQTWSISAGQKTTNPLRSDYFDQPRSRQQGADTRAFLCSLFPEACISVPGRLHQLVLLLDRYGIDRQAIAKGIEVFLPLRPFVIGQCGEGVIRTARDLIPDVLRLPEIQVER